MKHIIIGTAGHIDHGKTTLIKALTGRETDTTKEEKDRGISINLGFTFFDLPSGRRAGIIDVPGHEKFIKNMLAGVSGIDVVLLVIAADEGVMPQTEEHIEILQLLNVKKGVIAITKMDMVDEEWLSMVRDDVQEKIKGTFLEGCPMVNVSAKTGMGISELGMVLDKVTENTEAKDTEGHFRLPIDRVFSISGFGTVVTGTVISGRISLGDSIMIYPSKLEGKIRNIQVHDNDVEFGEAGQRCALNISGIKKDDIERGNVVSLPNMMEPSMMIDCSLYHIKSAEKPIENRQRLRLYHGTSEILCRVVILDKDEIKPGESAYVQMRLEKPLTCQRNDRYVIRSYSPMHTIAGGAIIEPNAIKAKRFNEEYIDNLRIKENGNAESIIESTVEKLSSLYPSYDDILKALGKNEEGLKDKLDNLEKEGKVISLKSLGKAIYIHKKFLNERQSEIENLLLKFHKDNPLKSGMSKEEIKSKVFSKNLKQKNYDEILSLLYSKKSVKQVNDKISLYDFNICYSTEQDEIKEYIIKSYDDGKFMPPKLEELLKSVKNRKEFKMVYESLLDGGELIKTGDDIVFLRKHYENAKDMVKGYIKLNGGITPSEARELFGSSRKYVVSLLENFDNIKLTKRLEDKRVMY